MSEEADMLKLRISPAYVEEVGTIEEASREVQAYIDRLGLGASEYEGAELYDAQGKYLGRFSYNGRLWPKGGDRR